ncbi:MAG TPA: hypothetical protein VK915_11500 [Gaiellaceae bacterium]|nr:hypothetical protein [Gaiellaceae bacterium]
MAKGVEERRKKVLAEETAVRRWRRGQFLALGFAPPEAEALTKAPVDLALVRKLVSAGCPLETVWRIVL